ncbi:MAG: glycosyltransferase family 2 protein [Gammaproteobacteria bacterium]
MKVSIIIPARDELEGLKIILPKLLKLFPDYELIVVNDGSEDETDEFCKDLGIQLIHHTVSLGNGAAIKAGARRARGDILVFMDADGQHRPEEIGRLLEKVEEGFDMVVGARQASSHASLGRLLANIFYNRFASFMVGKKVDDLTSGFRAVKAEYFHKFLYLLPNGFSYPTTCTMAFFRSGYSVEYVTIKTNNRVGKSHIRIVRDGVRFLLILFKIGTLYSPLKIFLPFSVVSFILGLSYYIYTYTTVGRFTNMSALLFTTSVIIFLMGLISEQITNLLYSGSDH